MQKELGIYAHICICSCLKTWTKEKEKPPGHLTYIVLTQEARLLWSVSVTRKLNFKPVLKITVRILTAEGWSVIMG